MNKYTFLISLIAFVLFQSACSSESKEGKEEQLSERELLYKEVMEIHNTVMPKMSDINRTKRKLEDQIKMDSLISDSVKSLVDNNIAELTEAETGMMDWMQAFKAPKESEPDQQVIDYLNKEKARISKVSDQMLGSLKNGTDLLNQLEESQKGYLNQ